MRAGPDAGLAAWTAVTDAAEGLADACEEWTARPGLPVTCGGVMYDRAQDLLSALAALWLPEPAAGVPTSPGTPAAGEGAEPAQPTGEASRG